MSEGKTILNTRPQTITHTGKGFMFQWGNELFDAEVGCAYLLPNGVSYYIRYSMIRTPGQRPGYQPLSRRSLTDEEVKYLEALLEESG